MKRAPAGANGTDILFQHRVLRSSDISFLSNRTSRAMQIDGQFHVSGRALELWHADSGISEPTSFRIEGAKTVVPLTLAREESVFVTFRRPASGPGGTIPPRTTRVVATLDAPWHVAFQPGRGARASLTMAKLAPLDRQAESGVKYFSGVATYTSRFVVPRGARTGYALQLDLGQIGDVAQVRVNGRDVGTVWHAPYRVNVTAAIRSGANTIEVRIANLWMNRLIGDAQPDAAPHSFVVAPTYHADAPLRPAGLIGPVTLLARSRAVNPGGHAD